MKDYSYVPDMNVGMKNINLVKRLKQKSRWIRWRHGKKGRLHMAEWCLPF